MATHYRIRAWKIPWTRSLAGFSSYSCKELDTTKATEHSHTHTLDFKGFPGGTVVPVANAGNSGEVGSIPGSGRSPGEVNGNPFLYSCLENSMDKGAWRAIVHRVAKSRTRLSD